MTEATDHDTPRDDVVYRHLDTDEIVRYLGREDGRYLLRVNAERTLRLRTEDWPTYRTFLGVDRYD